MRSRRESKDTAYYQSRKNRQVSDELVLMSYNVRGLNNRQKQEALHQVIEQQRPHLICLNETKLQDPLYIDGYWAHQTELQKSGGCWTAACKGINLTLTKSLRTYICWTKAILAGSCIYILNCYVEPGDSELVKKRAARISEIAEDIIRQDTKAQIVICGDFNKQLPEIGRALLKLKFTPAFDQSTVTHQQGGHLDQVFVRNMKITSAATSSGYYEGISDHKCLRVVLKLQD